MKDNLKNLLDSAYEAYNTKDSISKSLPDPLLEVYKHKSNPNLPYIALICALFSYGNVGAIIKFLGSLPFDTLDSKEQILKTPFPYYRFQNSQDVRALFLAINAFKTENDFSDFVKKHYRKGEILGLINACIKALYKHIPSESQDSKGLRFLIGVPDSSSPLKRWNMFMRWMVRKDNVDLGVWSGIIESRDLLLPLDVHTFRICRDIGLLKRKSYDIKAVLEVSENLLRFDNVDPIKYDFALYRIHQQNKAIDSI